jgi:hypothetical protein
MAGSADFLSNHHIVAGLYPVADCFAGGVATDIINMENYRRCTFLVMTGAIEDAAISNIVTVDACSTATATATTAISFRHRTCLSSATVDTWGALTYSAATGYNFADGASNGVANVMWLIEVDAATMEAEAAGYEFVRLAIAETVDKTITACVIVILSDPRYPGAVPVTAIA